MSEDIIDLTPVQFKERFGPEVMEGQEGDILSAAYDTYGDDLAWISQQDPRHVWTLIQEDGLHLMNGFHFCNRLAYVLTDRPWPEDAIVQVSVDCTDPSCPKCHPVVEVAS